MRVSRLTRTALLLPVPAADPLLRKVADRFPATARPGLPAHLTVLYPFVPAESLAAATVRACAEIAERTSPIDVRFTRCRVRGEMAYLGPEPVAPVDALLRAVRARWPGLTPYGGRFPDAPAHVTLALDGRSSDHAVREGARKPVSGERVSGRMRAVARLVDPLLPIGTTLDKLMLVTVGEGGWAVRGGWPLAADAGRTTV
jgi:2'-5' RNA ligase